MNSIPSSLYYSAQSPQPKDIYTLTPNLQPPHAATAAPAKGKTKATATVTPLTALTAVILKLAMVDPALCVATTRLFYTPPHISEKSPPFPPTYNQSFYPYPPTKNRKKIETYQRPHKRPQPLPRNQRLGRIQPQLYPAPRRRRKHPLPRLPVPFCFQRREYEVVELQER
ncbi:hypothetical protein XPA_008712 [Xanthoria parietina]